MPDKTPPPKGLKHSRPLDKHLWSVGREADALVRSVWEADFKDLGPTSGKAGKQPLTPAKDQFKVLLLNLFKLWQQDPTLCLGVSTSKSGYKARGPDNALHISSFMIRLINRLHSSGYIDWHKGSEQSELTTRIWPKEKLIQVFRESTLCLLDLHSTEKREVIILNKKKEEDSKGSKPLAYDDTPEIVAMREELKAYNELLRHTYVDIGDLEDPIIYKRDDGAVRIDQGGKFVRRIFFRGDWSLGGRFYGGWWQSINSEERSRILINDQETLELDYSGLHISLIYGLEKQQPPKDPYEVPLVYPQITPKQQRDWIKQLVLKVINAKSIPSGFRAFRGQIIASPSTIRFTDKTLRTLLDAFLAANPIVAPYLGTDKGVELMAMDGRITAQVINHFTKKNLPILTVHDSYILPHEYSGEMRTAMNAAINKELGDYSINITQENVGIDQYRAFKAQEPTNTYFHKQMLQNLPSIERCKQYQLRYQSFKKWLSKKEGW